jgi:hypothetical protein
MPMRDDDDYFARRASEERARAAACHDHGIARIHLTLAEQYDRKVAGRYRVYESVPSEVAAD